MQDPSKEYSYLVESFLIIVSPVNCKSGDGFRRDECKDICCNGALYSSAGLILHLTTLLHALVNTKRRCGWIDFCALQYSGQISLSTLC